MTLPHQKIVESTPLSMVILIIKHTEREIAFIINYELLNFGGGNKVTFFSPEYLGRYSL